MWATLLSLDSRIFVVSVGVSWDLQCGKKAKASEEQQRTFTSATTMSSEAKAAEYMSQGNKTLKKTSFFSFGSGSQKYDDASDLFEKAGNQFKIAKKCASRRRPPPVLSVEDPTDAAVCYVFMFAGQEASDAYEKCADCQVFFCA